MYRYDLNVYFNLFKPVYNKNYKTSINNFKIQIKIIYINYTLQIRFLIANKLIFFFILQGEDGSL